MTFRTAHRAGISSLIVAAALLSLCLLPVRSAEFSGQVVGVSDGDTITVMHSGVPERIRLMGIDCPEKRQPYGSRAKQYCSSLVFGRNVRVRVGTTDKYGRSVAEVILPDGRSVNQEMVAGGMAWWYRKYSTDHKLSNLEAQARTMKKGLWADSSAIAPWQYRAIEKGIARTELPPVGIEASE